MKKRFLAMLLLLVTVLVGCGDAAQTPDASTDAVSNDSVSVESKEESVPVSETPDDSSVADASEDVSEPEELKNRNILTGINDLSDGAVGKRPVAIMVNNIPAAMPQYGVDKADVVFEIPVEGFQTRLMCVFGDITAIPRVCSIRSCRKYFPALALGFDALYVNWGQTKEITSYVNSLGIVQIDGAPYGRNLFARDQERRNQGYAIEHTMYFEGSKLLEMCETSKIKTDLAENKTGMAFNFPENPEEVTVPTGDKCTDIYVDFGACEAGFTYNEETKTYFKTYFDSKVKKEKPHIDAKSNQQLNFTNLFILHTPVEYDKINSEKSHRLIKWQGGKNSVGYYISNGVKQQIYWIKETEKDSLKFYDMDGNELKVNCGKTYICFNEMKNVDFE